MRRPPPFILLPRYPVAGGACVLAALVTAASWSKKFDVGMLVLDPHLSRGQLWRLVTSALPHVDAMHLIFNIYWTWAFGTLIEEIWGSLRTAALFVLLAVGSGGAEYALLKGGVGLSGVGYGLFGLLWVLSRRDARFYGAVDKNTATLFVAWFFLCVFMTWMDWMPVGNIAHGMGAVLGALVGCSVAGHRKHRNWARAGLAALMAACVAGATLARPWINISGSRGIREGELGYQALKKEDNTDAIEWLKQATRLRPENAGYWFNMGIAHERLNNPKAALEAFERAHKLAPSEKDFTTAYEQAKIKAGS
jgi:membrane associated rhomboid family serine protease